ncbi:MAG: acyl-CoA synthetase FdrA [Elusimicrobiota bacterium]
MGTKKNIVKKNNYKDSVFLMEIAGNLEKKEGINSTSLMMGTPANKKILEESDLLTPEGKKASENDLIIAIDAQDKETINNTLEDIENAFETDEDTDEKDIDPPTQEAALKKMKDINMALISVPGEYAAREAKKALDNNLDVMIFSDNVSLENEIKLKEYASKKDLLLMGPDCGTAIINGVPLGFANRIPEGNIGIVAASGSGLQEVTVTIAKQGAGITQAIGTGGRDLSKEVGGISMLKGLDILKDDPDTEIILLLSKPPHPDIAEKILEKAQKINKPFVVCFLGASEYKSKNNLNFTSTIEGAGIAASQLAGGEEINLPEYTADNVDSLLKEAAAKVGPQQKFIRGLYAGGTLCDEAIDILNRSGLDIYSNAGVEENFTLEDPFSSTEHTLVDLGEDEFTKGRPHPMIDLSLRNKRLLQESKDEDVAVILFDLVLGYAANPDPAGDMAETLGEISGKKVMVASVCGTDMDPQNFSKQVKILRDNGVIVLPTNAQAAKFTARIINEVN